MERVGSVLITGASSGIGRACALRMDALGWRVFAGVRSASDQASLQATASDKLVPVLLDVTDGSAIQRARDTVEATLGQDGLFGVVNNAGIAYGGPVEFLELDQLRATYEVNFFGVVAVSQAFIPLLRETQGRIVNMSSVSGVVASPFLSPYSTSRWALEALSDAMRVELAPWRIRVIVIQPGPIDTPIWSKGRDAMAQILERVPPGAADLYRSAVDTAARGLKPHGLPPERVASAVEHALTFSRPRTRYVVGASVTIARLFARLPDGVRDAVFKFRLRGRG